MAGFRRGSAVPLDDANVYGTRWKGAGVVILGALVPVVAIGAAVSQGVLAMAFTSTSSDGLFVTAGAAASDIGVVLAPQRTKDFDGNVSDEWALEAAVSTANADGICFTQQADLLGQTITLLITSSDPAIQIEGVRATLLNAATYVEVFGNVSANKNAADVATGGTDLEGLVGELGIEAGSLRTRNTSGTIRASSIRGASLASFSLRFAPGDVSCPEPVVR